MNPRLKHLTYLLVSIVSLGMIVSYGLPEKETSTFETDVFTALKTANEQMSAELPDLVIENVYLKKIASVGPESNYSKYNSTIILHNNGGAIKDKSLTLNAGKNQKYVFVKNTTKGFSLGEDKTYIINDYDVLLDKNNDVGSLKFKVSLMDAEDANDASNEYIAAVQ
jgi:hypothetical protein